MRIELEIPAPNCHISLRATARLQETAVKLESEAIIDDTMLLKLNRYRYRSAHAPWLAWLLSIAMCWVSAASMAGASLTSACVVSSQQCTVSVQGSGTGQVAQIAIPDEASDSGDYEKEGRAIKIVTPMDELESNNGLRRAPSSYFAKRGLHESESGPLPHRPEELLRPPIAV